MEGLILLLIPVALLSLAVLAAWMVVDVAFLGGDRKVEERRRALRRWQPPYIGGRELVAWARATAREAVERALARRPSEDRLTDLADDLHEGASRAMLPRVRAGELRRAEPCPEGGQGEIGVTAAEALALADRIRTTLPKREQEKILRRATAIAAARPVTLALKRPNEPPPCALQGDDCVCMTYGDRPLRCRPYHAGVALRRLGPTVDGVDGEATGMAHAREVVEGVEEGLGEALQIAGLDSDVYELNAALSLALSKPDATGRWLDGEPLFATCAHGPTSFPRV
jgi:hypothetical protein